ncbi:MAG TPA: hypothetical protein VGE38_04875 [Nocardioides sp.]|uniref:hypothetical protein n=1 Tax=Nocardioides sp. TaxID=35761 RepID=UPI002EDBB7D1
MARQSRPLKTAFWDDDKVCHLSRDARLTLAGLITKMADDEGRFIATPVAVSGSLFPYDDLPPARVKKWLGEIEAEGMVCVYRVNGGTYGALTGWAKHQKPPHPTESTIPPPPEERS